MNLGKLGFCLVIAYLGYWLSCARFWARYLTWRVLLWVVQPRPPDGAANKP